MKWECGKISNIYRKKLSHSDSASFGYKNLKNYLHSYGIMLIVGVVLIFIAGVILEIELWESRVIANCVIFGILLFIVTECKRKKENNTHKKDFMPMVGVENFKSFLP